MMNFPANVYYMKRSVESTHRGNRGFTALYAVLVASLALSIGLAVANIALKESLLSSYARESQFAFYAANSGIECARLMDIYGVWDAPDLGELYQCNGEFLDVTILGGGIDCSVGCSFRVIYTPDPDPACVDVTVQKVSGGSPTIIIARGYNTCNEDNPRRVERGLGIIY